MEFAISLTLYNKYKASGGRGECHIALFSDPKRLDCKLLQQLKIREPDQRFPRRKEAALFVLLSQVRRVQL